MVTLALLLAALGAGFLTDFREITSRSYDRASRPWGRSDYEKAIPYAAYRYFTSIWFFIVAVVCLLAAALGL